MLSRNVKTSEKYVHLYTLRTLLDLVLHELTCQSINFIWMAHFSNKAVHSALHRKNKKLYTKKIEKTSNNFDECHPQNDQHTSNKTS